MLERDEGCVLCGKLYQRAKSSLSKRQNKYLMPTIQKINK